MLDWFAQRWNALVDFLYSLVLSLLDILKDLFYFIIESLFALVLLMLDGLGALFSGLNVTQYISAIPPGTAHIMSSIGLAEAMGMIVVCITIRIGLQLIPFVRLGS